MTPRVVRVSRKKRKEREKKCSNDITAIIIGCNLFGVFFSFDVRTVLLLAHSMLLLSLGSASLESIWQFNRNWKNRKRCALARLTQTNTISMCCKCLQIDSNPFQNRIRFVSIQLMQAKECSLSYQSKTHLNWVNFMCFFLHSSTFPLTMLNYRSPTSFIDYYPHFQLSPLHFFRSHSTVEEFFKTLFRSMLNLFLFYHQFILVVSKTNEKSVFFGCGNEWKYLDFLGICTMVHVPLCRHHEWSERKKNLAQLGRWIALLQFNCFRCITNVCSV